MSNEIPLTPSRPGGNGSRLPAVQIVLRNVGQINPESLDDYLGRGGYAALRKAVGNLGPAGTLDIVEKANLRGRGGAGFPAARKWRIVASAATQERCVIANAFGADPAALGDRMLLENDPHSVLEGLAIAAFAVGASRAFVYCCLDQKLAVERVRKALRQAEERGLLGSGIAGSNFDCHVSIVGSPAGFASGEETAAIAVIEGKRPMPEQRPPYPAEAGLHGNPTLVNNAETLANVPWIVTNGADAFVNIGSAGHAGTKLVTLVGAATRPGLVEVPLGTPLRAILAEYAGGVRQQRALKAVQIGGPTGGLLPANALDVKLEFEALEAAGTTMGSGSMLVLDESACMVDLLCSQLELLSAESCGRCVPCRLGTKRLHMVLDQVAKGAGHPGDLDLLDELAANMADGAVCGYGITAANPVRGALRHFRAEFEAHLGGGQCPAGQCAIRGVRPEGAEQRREELWKSKWPIRR